MNSSVHPSVSRFRGTSSSTAHPATTLWLMVALGTALVLLTALVLVMQGVVRGSESRRHVQADEARLDWQCQGQAARVMSACQGRGDHGSVSPSLLATAQR